MNLHRTRQRLIGLIVAVSSSNGMAADRTMDTEPLITSPPTADYALTETGATLSVCYDWSCANRKQVTFDATELARVRAAMDLCRNDGLHNRLQRARIGVWQMEVLAQQRIPVLANDRGLNDRDAEVAGRTDCVDNAANTTSYLKVLAELGALPGWTVGAPEVRDLFTKDIHWTATLIDADSGHRWAVDSWFRPNGHLPFVSPISDWSAAHKPWEAPLDRDNPYPRTVAELCPKTE